MTDETGIEEKRKSERRVLKKRRIRKIPISGEDRRTAEFDRRKEERRKQNKYKEENTPS